MKSERRDTPERTGELPILNETEYFDQCAEYALAGGWIKPEEKDTLIQKYLRPIHQKYLELIEEIRREVMQRENGEEILASVIEKMNTCMKATQRIGSTDPGNILRSIAECYRFNCKTETYAEYAVNSLHSTIAEVLSR